MVDAHASVSAEMIAAFVEVDRATMVCFRCGQNGHLRHQCLTFKVKRCWHHAHGRCTDPHCSFAHSDDELRTPWAVRCVRVVKQGDRYISIGCNSTEHTFRRCPLQQGRYQ